MKYQKKLIFIFTTCFLALTLTSCGKMNTKKLAAKASEAMNGKQITQSTLILDMEMEISLNGISTKMTMNGTTDTKLSLSPYSGYSETKMDISMAEELSTVSSQTYVLEEDSAPVSYTHTDEDNSWNKQTLENLPEPSSTTDTFAEWTAHKAPEDLTLAEETETLNGQEVYVLTATLSGKEMQTALNSIGSADEILSDSDLDEDTLSSSDVPVTYYLDTETFLPVQMKLDLQNVSALVNSLISELTDDKDTNPDIQITRFNVTINNIAFDPVTIPQVPKEGVIIGSQDSYNPLQKDGSYVIQESGDAVRISVSAADWAADDMGYDSVILHSIDQTQSVTYTMYTGVNGMAFYTHLERTDALPLLNQGTYEGHGHGAAIDDYETAWVKSTDGTNMYYAWKPVGNAYLYVKMIDGNHQSLENALTPLLKAVNDFQL